MSRCPKDRDPDLIHVKYSSVSNRATRLLLLEQVAEAYLKEHQGMKDFTAGFGTKVQCDCPFCDKARQAFELRDKR